MNWRALVWHLGIILLVAIPATCAFLLLYLPYESFTAQVFGTYQQPDKLEKFRHTLLTSDRFHLLRICFSIITGICLLMGIFLWKQYQQVFTYGHRIKEYFLQKGVQALQCWQGLSHVEKYVTIGLFVILLISRLYFLFQVPFHIDERFTYLYFVNKGIGVSIAYYPNPNNHIFFTLICTLSSYLLADPWLVMKIPAFLMGLLLVFVYWAVIRSFFSATVSILATVLFAYSGGVWYYGLQGRGYSLLMICLLIAIRSIFFILVNHKNYSPAFFWFWLSSVLGFYTIPIFIYPFAGIMLFGSIYAVSQKKYVIFRHLCICAVLIIISTFILYLPVFVFNGWNAITGNSWVIPMPWDTFLTEIPAHLLSMTENMWGYFPVGQWWLLITLIYSAGVLIWKAHSTITRKWIALFLSCLLALLMISIAQRLLLFQRLILYLSVFQYLILALIIVDLFSFLVRMPVYKYYLVSSVGIFYIIFNTFQFYKATTPERFDLYDSFDAVSALLYNKQADGIFVNMYEYGLCIRFQYETQGRLIHLDSQQTQSGSAYNYLVLHKDYTIPPQISLSPYRVIYSDAEAVVYERISL